MSRWKLGLLLVLPAALVGAPMHLAAAADRRVGFNRDVRTILSEHCNYCHGPDPKHREADLRLDDRDVALKQGAIVPGKPGESELIARILSDDPDEVMPPPEAHKELSAAQKDTLRRWVEQGAEYQPHWAYVAPARPEPPATKRRDWARNTVDAFVLEALEAKGIAPSAEADRPTLLRRLSLDLIGLPPSPEEVRAFVEDAGPRAYENQVDRLLASPHYGERMAVPWLDLARFADSVGYHGDQGELTFPYRDYVIDAFNRNLPFDRFAAEQLAGDLMPGATEDQVVASGFNRLNMMTREGGAQPSEYLAKYAADRVRTVSITFLGSTMGCAECHDHKFDPFKARDFYRLAAFFADLKQWGVYTDYDYTPNPDLRGYNNDSPFPPIREVASPALRRRRERLDRAIGRTLADSAGRLAADPGQGERFAAWQAEALATLRRSPDGWDAIPDRVGEEFGPAEVFARPANAQLLVGPARPNEATTFRARPAAGWLSAVRVELLPDAFHGGSILRGGAGGATVTVSATLAPAAGSAAQPLPLAYAEAGRKDDRFVNGEPATGVLGGWNVAAGHLREPQAAVWLLDRPARVAEGAEVVVEVKGSPLGCVRVALSPFGLDDPADGDAAADLARALDLPAGARSPGQADLLARAYLLGTAWDGPALARYAQLRAARQACRDGRALAQVTEARAEPAMTRVLARGNWQDTAGEIVLPGVPAFLPQPPDAGARRLNRLDLARWIGAPGNPLTARVFVNRLWKQLFGTGLSAVMEDVGAQGEWPSHPELLDWLAVEFRDGGWDVKHMVRLMVSSAAYRQQSRARPELHDLDPGNRLLAFQNPRRLDAEFVRDNALAIAGLLDPEVGGPSAFPYQPPGYYAAIQYPDRDYYPDRDERQYRRGVYAHWQRTFLHPMLANFDAPAREECTANRNTANSPQQALTLLNDPTFVEAARVLAGELLASGGPDAERIDRLFRKTLARPATPREAASLAAFLDGQRSACRSNPGDSARLVRVGQAPVPAGVDAAELAAWTELCRVVLNLHETITRY